MKRCDCNGHRTKRRVVLTGGPGSGKTAVLELIRLFFCRHVTTLPEAAGIVFAGRFPREETVPVRQAGQRVIYHVQRELECIADAGDAAVVLCDRSTVDATAYWLGDGDLFSAVGTTLEQEMGRYDAVIHLRTPAADAGYAMENPLRIETAEEAAAIDGRLAEIWAPHPRRFSVDATPDFLTKAARALALLRDEVPACCRHHVADFLWERPPEPRASGSGRNR